MIGKIRPVSGEPMGSAHVSKQPEPSPVRVARDLEELSRIAGDGRAVVSRLAQTSDERAAHALVSRWMTEADLVVRVDAFGNTIGERSGRRDDLPYLVMGSHLDSVPTGGRFDGAVGVVGALEVARSLRDAEMETEHPLRLVAFANEEGARFGEACLGSKAVVGAIGPKDTLRLRDLQGVTLAEAMRSLAFDPDRISDAVWRTDEAAAFLELHIEQGRILEDQDIKLGIVDSVAGNTRLRIELHGQAGHSGATPMTGRKDALAAASEVVLGVESIASRTRTTVGTVGQLDVTPNNITTVPGAVRFSVDVRDIDSVRQREAAASIVSLADEIAARRGVRLVYEIVSDTSPSVLHRWLRQIVGNACEDLGFPYKILASGAGHDAQVMARRFPAALIFVPSHGGASHVPEEWTSVEDVTIGVRALLQTLLSVDRS